MCNTDGSTTDATSSPRANKIWVPGTDTMLPLYVDLPVTETLPVDTKLVSQDSQDLSPSLAEDLSGDGADRDTPEDAPAGGTGGLKEEETTTNKTTV